MKSENRPGHITKGDVFDDLGLPRSEASALQVQATLLDALLREIEKQDYTESDLVEMLGEYQPSVSNFHKVARRIALLLDCPEDRIQQRHFDLQRRGFRTR